MDDNFAELDAQEKFHDKIDQGLDKWEDRWKTVIGWSFVMCTFLIVLLVHISDVLTWGDRLPWTTG